jgi:hypothetical protein
MVGGGCGNKSLGYGSFVGGGVNNCDCSTNCFGVVVGGVNNRNGEVTCYNFTGGGVANINASHTSVIGGGQNNCASGTYSSNLGGCGNTASAYASTALGGYGSVACGCFSSTIGVNSSAYLYGQNALASGQFSATGDAQSSTLISRRSAGSLTSGATMLLSLDGTGVTNLIIPPTGKTWAVKIQYASRVVGVSGTATGVTINDSKTQTQEIGVKNIGGVTTILSGSPNNGIALEDPSMNTASMSYSVGASNEIVMTFTAPIFAGGGSLTIKAVATLSITEVL